MMEVLQFPGFRGDADVMNDPACTNVPRSLRRRYQTKVLVATFVSGRAIAGVKASGFGSCVEGCDAGISIPSSNCFVLSTLI